MMDQREPQPPQCSAAPRLDPRFKFLIFKLSLWSYFHIHSPAPKYSPLQGLKLVVKYLTNVYDHYYTCSWKNFTVNWVTLFFSYWPFLPCYPDFPITWTKREPWQVMNSEHSLKCFKLKSSPNADMQARQIMRCLQPAELQKKKKGNVSCKHCL